MQDIAAKYPKWLKEHRCSLSHTDVASYEAQIEHIEGVISHLEEHGDSKFPELLSRLQQVLPPHRRRDTGNVTSTLMRLEIKDALNVVQCIRNMSGALELTF
jgi:hypothetical protein